MELIFYKDTDTGLYVDFTSFLPWTYRASSLVTWASCIGSTDKLPSEITSIKIFALWNDFPKSVVNSIINKTLSITADSHNVNEKSNGVLICSHVPYYSEKDCSLIKSYICKIKSNCKKEQPMNFIVLYDVTKIDFFLSTKDKMPTLNQSFAVYKFVCPGCSAYYIGKTEKTLFERNVEHAQKKTIVLLTSILINIMVFSICSILQN